MQSQRTKKKQTAFGCQMLLKKLLFDIWTQDESDDGGGVNYI